MIFIYSEVDALKIANKLGIVFDKFSLSDFTVGINIETEHGLKNKLTNVTYNDPILTAKIALAHLNELPNYYNFEVGLPEMEKRLKKLLQNE